VSGRIARGGWFALGWVAVGLGSVGVIVPGLPTTVFFVIAAACFSRSSPRFEQWVLDRPGVGPLVRDYRAGLGMPRTAKVMAIVCIAVVCSLSAFLGFEAWWLRAVVLGLGAVGVAWLLWRIPTRAEPEIPPLAPAGRWFRAAAFAEAATWLALLVGMAVKHVGSGSERGVEVFGPIHGVVVLVYVAVTLVTATRLRWGGRTLALALLASVPPLGTVVFETWAGRAGRLSDPASRRFGPDRGRTRNQDPDRNAVERRR
jgi:integral membrane protein